MIEVQDIFQRFGADFINAHNPSPHVQKVIRAIQNCRTAALGAHVDECSECDYTKISYNSCRNRHCPKCQVLAEERWVMARQAELLPVPYFHVVFTLPSELGVIALRNQKTIQFNNLISSLYRKNWYVYCKRPFKTANSVLEYLGRYTHRVAISNHRISSLEDGQVSFTWRDYRDKGKSKIMKLPVMEFIRRFLLHVLPPRFTKIRHYGFLASAVKGKKLTLCKCLLNIPQIVFEILSTAELIQKLTGIDITVCPACGSSLCRASP
jgi:hypothetical protein